MGESFYYLTFITDLFSRRILGYIASKTLLTEYTTIPAIQMALKERGKTKIPGLIIHSDGGGQYYSKAFGKITKAAGMKNSMGKSVYENPHAEGINGIIKKRGNIIGDGQHSSWIQGDRTVRNRLNTKIALMKAISLVYFLTTGQTSHALRVYYNWRMSNKSFMLFFIVIYCR